MEVISTAHLRLSKIAATASETTTTHRALSKVATATAAATVAASSTAVMLAILSLAFDNLRGSVRKIVPVITIMVVVKLASCWSLRLTIFLSRFIAAATTTSHASHTALAAHTTHSTHTSLASHRRALVVPVATLVLVVVSVPILALVAVSSVGSVLAL